MQEHSISRTGCFSIPNQLLVVEEGQGIKLTQLCPFLFFQSANAPPHTPADLRRSQHWQAEQIQQLEEDLEVAH